MAHIGACSGVPRPRCGPVCPCSGTRACLVVSDAMHGLTTLGNWPSTYLPLVADVPAHLELEYMYMPTMYVHVSSSSPPTCHCRLPFELGTFFFLLPGQVSCSLSLSALCFSPTAIHVFVFPSEPGQYLPPLPTCEVKDNILCSDHLGTCLVFYHPHSTAPCQQPLPLEAHAQHTYDYHCLTARRRAEAQLAEDDRTNDAVWVVWR